MKGTIGVKGSRLGRAGASVLPKGDDDGPRRDLAILQRWKIRIIASLCPRPSVRGE